VIYGPYPPLAAEHPIVTNGTVCGECGEVIGAGDVVGLQPMEGQSADTLDVECLPVHWRHAQGH
jgi:hypothetical protein